MKRKRKQNEMKTRRGGETVAAGEELGKSKHQQLMGKEEMFQHVTAEPRHRKQKYCVGSI
jgi:hypothetical protein